MTIPIEVIRFPEPVEYAGMLQLQTQRREDVFHGRAPDTLFLLEHRPVITLGRNAHRENLLAEAATLAEAGVTLHESNRGGDITYHGPGQLVAYPILNLNHWQASVGWYLRTLEEVLIDLLATYQLEGERMPGFTGVWTQGAKVAAIGIGVHQWVTFHGIALNVDPDMAHFGFIIPCGIPDHPVTSLRHLLPDPPPLPEVAERFEACFMKRFDGACH